MNYKKLIEAHKAFYDPRWEPRAPRYDEYMQSKNWQEWSSTEVSSYEIQKLFNFIRKWDPHFRGNIKKFLTIYKEICPHIRELETERIEDFVFNDDKKEIIRKIFNEVARCAAVKRYESTDASKILHTILPNFFVMWDDEIRKGIVENGKTGIVYAFYFLPKMQKELEEAANSCANREGLDREKALNTFVKNATIKHWQNWPMNTIT